MVQVFQNFYRLISVQQQLQFYSQKIIYNAVEYKPLQHKCLTLYILAISNRLHTNDIRVASCLECNYQCILLHMPPLFLTIFIMC